MIKNNLFFTLPEIQSSSQDPRMQNPNSFASHLSVPMADASGCKQLCAHLLLCTTEACGLFSMVEHQF
eukprot:4375640-Ditylum_brightwellii.AAC.1